MLRRVDTEKRLAAANVVLSFGPEYTDELEVKDTGIVLADLFARLGQLERDLARLQSSILTIQAK